MENFDKGLAFLNKATAKFYSEEELEMAVHIRGYTIMYIDKPTDKMKRIAICDTPHHLEIITTASKEIIDFAFYKNRYNNEPEILGGLTKAEWYEIHDIPFVAPKEVTMEEIEEKFGCEIKIVEKFEEKEF